MNLIVFIVSYAEQRQTFVFSSYPLNTILINKRFCKHNI